MPTRRFSLSSSRHLLSFRRSHSAPAARETLPPPKKLNIILTLDGVFFAHPFHTTEKADNRYQYRSDNSTVLLYFLRTASLFFTKSPRSVPRCVLPGVIELLQLLYSPEIAPWINISVFNQGYREDTRTLFAELLIMALGKERGEQIIQDTQICGYNDYEEVSKEHLLLLRTLYGLETQPTHYQKNIYKIVSKEDKSNTLLLDANPDSICYHQAKNYCAAPFVNLQSFSPSTQASETSHDASNPIFQQLNSIYYIAARLMKSITLFKQLQEQVPSTKVTTVTDELFQFHFASIPQSQFDLLKRFTPRFQENFCEQDHYRTGFDLLKQFNSELTFLDHSQIKLVLEKPITASEQTALEKKRPIESHEPAPFCPGATSKLVI